MYIYIYIPCWLFPLGMAGGPTRICSDLCRLFVCRLRTHPVVWPDMPGPMPEDYPSCVQNKTFIE